MTLLARVVAFLEAHDIATALIGGFALAAHGIARATLDADLLVADRSVLDPSFWRGWSGSDQIDARRGDPEDPLAGVVRWTDVDDAVDIVVAKHRWQADLLQRREHVAIEGRQLPVVDRAGLILLKLYAGGPQDVLDVRLLLAANLAQLGDEVERRLADCSPSLCAAWRKLRDSPVG